MTDERKAFEAHVKELHDDFMVEDWRLWQAACAYQRERDAGICEGHGTGGFSYAAAIRGDK